MVNPFKKYNLDRAEFETPGRLQGVSALKQELIQKRKRHTAEELLEYESVDAFREQNEGPVPAEIAKFYRDLEMERFNRAQRAVSARERAYERDALVSNVGLETAGGRFVNSAVGVVSETLNKWVSDAATLPDTINTNKMLDGIPEEVLELHRIRESGERELTKEELARFDEHETKGIGKRVTEGINPLDIAGSSMRAATSPANGLTYGERIERAKKSLERSQNISEAFENSATARLYNRRGNDELMSDIGATYDKHSGYIDEASKDVDRGDYGSAVVNTMIGVGKMIGDGAGDLLANPGATFEFIAQQAPYLVVGAQSKAVLGAINASYATDIYREKLVAYEQEHGRPPPEDDRTSMAIWSGTAALAEQAGNMTMLGALKGRAGFSKAVTKILEKTPDTVQKTANNVLTRNMLRVGKTAAAEGMTEVYQTAVEESETNPFDGTASGKAIFTAGLLGAAAGGGFASIGASGEILTSAAGKAGEAMSGRAKLRFNTDLVNQYTQEIKDGTRDVDSLLDSSDPRTYHPARAAALDLRRALNPDLSSEEQKAAKERADKIQENLEQQIIDQRAALAAETNKTERKKISRSIRENQEHLRRTNDAHSGFSVMLDYHNRNKSENESNKSLAEEIAEDVKTATQPEVTEETQAATGRAIRSMAMNSELFSKKTLLTDLKKLKESPSITQEQKDYISGIEASFTTENAIANLDKKIKEVASNILDGDVGFKGVMEYRRDVSRALRSGNTEKATAEIQDLQRFAQEHSRKLEAAKAARDIAIQEGVNTYIFKDPSKEDGWQAKRVNAKTGTPWGATPRERKQNRVQQSQLGGFEFVRQKNGKVSGEEFIANIENEVSLINAMGIELSRAMKVAKPENNTETASAQASTATAATPVEAEQAPEPEVVPEPEPETRKSVAQIKDEIVARRNAEDPTPSKVVAKAREFFVEKGVSPRDLDSTESAIKNNLGPEAAAEFRAEVDQLQAEQLDEYQRNKGRGQAEPEPSPVNEARQREQTPESVESNESVNLEAGFDASVVPQLNETAATDTGNINVDRETDTTPETAQTAQVASQEVENTQDQTNRTQNEFSGDNSTEPVTAESVRTAAIEYATSASLPDPEGLVDLLIQQHTETDEATLAEISTELAVRTEEAQNTEAVADGEIDIVASYVAQIDNIETEQETKRFIQQVSKEIERLRKRLAQVVGNKREAHQRFFGKRLDELEQLLTAPIDESTYLSIADKLNALRKRLARMPDDKNTANMGKALDRIERQLADRGYVIGQLLGEQYVEGMVVTPTFVADESLAKGEQRITRITKPQVSRNGKVIQVAEVQVSVGENTNTTDQPTPKLEEEPEVETVPVEGPVYSPGSDNANQSVLEMRRDSDSFTYTQDQAEALQGLMKAIGQGVKGTVSWLLLEGKAGTGKTTLVENLVNASNAAGKPVLVLAPTNKAVQVLKGKLRGVQGITKESTIHKMIYGAPSKNKKTGKIKFSRFKEDAFESGTEYTIFLDEASMVNLDQMQDLERALDMAGAKARIVLLGDGNQLEPIGKDPKIFSEDSAIQIDGKWSLQEVRRQSLDSNILKIATATADQQTPIVPVDGDYGDTRVLPLNEAAELAVEEVSQDPKNSVILVSTNNVRNRSNAEVRERIYGDDAETTPLFEGEPLIGQANTEALVNSETINAPPIKKLLGTVTLSTAKGDQLAYVYELESGQRLLLATALPGPSLQGDALFSDKSALAQSLLFTNEQGKKTGKFDPEIMVATYAYALTIHKSQGSQWRNVFVLPNWLHRDWAAYRVVYTAVTRASDTLTIGASPNVFTQERVSMQELENTVNDYIGRTAKPGVRADGTIVGEQSKETQTETNQSDPVQEEPRPAFDALPERKEGAPTLTYAGIGSRKVPKTVREQMTKLAAWLDKKGYSLNTGDATGSDKAFSDGTNNKRIFVAADATPRTIKIAEEIHPAPERLTDYPKKLMARNTNQVFGENLDTPVDFILTWTPDGAETTTDRTRNTGGTGQAIEMAHRKGIPVINMANKNWRVKLKEALAAAKSTQADATTQAQAAPAAQEPDVGVEAQTETEQTQEPETKEKASSPLFRQRKAGKNAVTVNPLTTKENIMEMLTKSRDNLISILQRYIEKDITAEQSKLLNHFAGFAKTANETLLKINGPRPNERFEHDDLVKSFGDVIPEDIRAGIIASVYSIIGEDGWKTRNSNADINALMNRDVNIQPSARERRALGDEPIMRQNVFARKLGRRVIQFMNIQAMPNLPANTLPNLEVALGAYAIGLMLEEGLLLKQESNREVSEILNQTSTRKHITHNLVMINVNDPKVKTIVKNTRGTGNVLAKLFGIEQGMTEPASKPGSYRAQNENAELAQEGDSEKTPILKKNTPSFLARALEKVSKRKQVLNKEVGDKLAQFGEAGIARLAGSRTEEDGMIHEGMAKSIAAANEGILRDVQSWLDFRKSNDDAPFYLTPVVWIQQRVGLAHSVMNPQSSKVHRHLMYPKSWETEIDPKSGEVDVMLFKVAVAQGMGFAVDKKNLNAAVEQFDELMQDPVMQAGMTAINKETLDDTDKAAIEAAVKMGGENLWSFHVLVEAAKYTQGKPFKTNVMVEIDGVTNGPALTNLMLGTIGPWLGSKVGLFQRNVSQQYGINNHSEFKEGGGRDMYESLAHLVQKELDKALANEDNYQVIQDILYFTGSFSNTSGRKRVKTPLTSLKFGSGLDGTIENMADEFITLYYEAVEKSSDDNNFIAQQEIKERINRLLPASQRVNYIDKALTITQQNSIKAHFSRQVGKAVKTALETQFGAFMERRKEIYAASKALFEAYQAAYTTLYEQALKEGVEDGSIKVARIEGRDRMIHDLSQEKYDELDRKLGDMMPMMHTALSKLSNPKDRTKGLMLAKRTTQEEEDSNIYRQKIKFSKRINNNFNKPGSDGTRTLSEWVRVRAQKLSWEEPGVRAVVLGIHSTDSAIAARTYDQFNGLNIHDAIGFRLKDVLQGGRALNKNTFRVMAEYSMPIELLNSLQASHDALAAMYKSLPADQQRTLLEKIQAINLGTERRPIPYNQNLIDGFAGIAYQMEVDKLKFMSELDKVSQYSLDGTEYQVTNSDRKVIDDLLVAAEGKLAQYSAQGNEPHTEVLTEQEETPNKTPWGMVGSAKMNSDPNLVALFGESGKVTAREMIQHLKKRINAGGRTPELIEFEKRLLAAVTKAINPDMEIRLITSKTDAIEGIEKLQTSMGFYHPDGWIGIKAPEFQDSMVTTETLMHELIHAATDNTLYRVKNGQDTTPAAKEAYKSLQELLKKARAYIQKEGLTYLEEGVESVEELISWGLSNADFQDQVLSKIRMDSDSQQDIRNRSKDTGFMAFIKSLAGLIFKNRNNEFFESGLGSLVANSAILIKHAGDKNNGTKPENTNDQPIRSMSFGKSAFSMTPQEVFDALVDETQPVNQERASYLKTILTNITDAVFQDGAFKERAKRETPFTAEDVFAENIKNGEPAFTSDIAAVMELSAQEHYVLESLELAMRTTLGLKEARPINREAVLMFTKMRSLGPSIMYDGNWENLNSDQKAYYKSLFDAIFTVEKNSEGRSIFLSKFLAAAAVYPPLSNAMSKIYLQKGELNLQGLTLRQRIKKLMELGWSMLMRWIAKARTQDSYVDTAAKLIREMVRLEKKQQRRIEKAAKRGETGLEARANKLAQGVREGLGKAAQNDLFKKSKSTLIRTGSNISQLTMEGRVGNLMDAIKKVRDNNSDQKAGFWAQSWVELRGDDNILAKLTQLLSDTKTMEQKRKRFNIEVGEQVENAFEGTLSKEESEAMTKVLVRTGAHILMDNHSMTEIHELVSDSLKRKKRIDSLIQQLPAQERAYYAEQARALGVHMATGQVDSALLMRNAYNIANKLGTSQKFTVPKDVAAAAEPIIDEIATLVAIDNQGAPSKEQMNYREHANNVMLREFGRNTVNGQSLNGVEFLLRSHKEMEREAHKSLFGSDKTQIVKGYTKDTYNPYIDVVVARKADWDKLKKAGYTRVEHDLLKDDADPRGEEFGLFTAKTGGIGQSVTSIVANTGRQRQGTSVVGDLQNDPKGANKQVLDQVASLKAPAIKALMQGKPDNGRNNALVPVLDTKGNIISWRYMMTEVSRDKVLGRKNNVGKVMGNIASSIVDKTQTPLINKNAVDALRAIYEDNFVDNSEAFIEFGPNSKDPEIRERYRLLPDATKEYIRLVWGQDKMIIRNDTYNILFGYRKLSIKNVLDIDPDERNILQKILTGILGEYELRDEKGEVSKRIAKKRGKIIMQGEDVWQELVTQIKDILVIKSLFTLLGNESSNLTVLLMHGVSPIEVLKQKIIGYASTKEYIAHRREKESLERTVSLGHLQGQYLADAQQRITMLEELMTANPVSEIMDGGMYQTLVEDVSQEEDPYSYQSGLSEAIENKTRWVPKSVKTTAKTLVLAHGTPIYDTFNDLTVMSDFTSRYVLNEHLKNRVTKKLSPEDRRSRVRDAFVDYDVPTSKQMQYLNDMGLVWFSKYYMRIQHVILQMVKENPVRALQIWAIADWLYSLPDILDSSLINKDIGNSLGTGAFEIMDAPKEIYTMHLADKIL